MEGGRQGNDRFLSRRDYKARTLTPSPKPRPLTSSKLHSQSGTPKPALPQPSPSSLLLRPQTPVILGSSPLPVLLAQRQPEPDRFSHLHCRTSHPLASSLVCPSPSHSCSRSTSIFTQQMRFSKRRARHVAPTLRNFSSLLKPE